MSATIASPSLGQGGNPSISPDDGYFGPLYKLNLFFFLDNESEPEIVDWFIPISLLQNSRVFFKATVVGEAKLLILAIF